MAENYLGKRRYLGDKDKIDVDFQRQGYTQVGEMERGEAEI